MIKQNFNTREEYLQFVRNIFLFTTLQAYNGQCDLWKEDDLVFIKKLDDKSIPNGSVEKIEALNVYRRAEKEYGNEQSWMRRSFKNYTYHRIFEAFGLRSPDFEEGLNYCAAILDVDLSRLETAENFPKEFPVLVVIEGDGHDLETDFIYKSAFDVPVELSNWDWLEANVRKFWKGESGSVW